MSVTSGMKLSHYELAAPLGTGGMGEVYVAHDTRLERDVAIKVLPPAFSSDPNRLERFVHEAKILASLNHPNIGAIYGLEETTTGEKYLVLELVEGESLSECLARGPLPLEKAVCLCNDIAEALEAAHERGIIHCDLKPGNVIVTVKGTAKVLDFGLARRWSTVADEVGAIETSDHGGEIHEDSTITFPLRRGVGFIEGTPGYMSPEQVRGEEPDRRTDVFSFGCVLYECLTGQRAFGGQDAGDRIDATLTSEPDWSALHEGIPQQIRDLLSRCLERDIARRFANISEVRRELEKACGPESAAAPASSTPNNLPYDTTSFVGRDQELSECKKLLGERRVLTLTGVGGIGKTRLALKLARSLLKTYPEGVWFVDFAPLSDSALVVQTVATALGVREKPGSSLLETLERHVADKRILIVLDNCEHLIAVCAEVVERFLAAGPNLRLIVTSREGLGISGEQSLVVRSLSLPSSGTTSELNAIKTAEAGRLFVDRARLVQSAFEIDSSNAPMIAEICRRLEGIPLAIELAAARVRVLSPEQIRARLDDRFRLLTGGSKTALPRHQTLHATIQWSYDQLKPDEQETFRLLSVFAGGWTLDAATQVLKGGIDTFEALDALSRLVDKSLVLMERDGKAEPRYRMLETVRQYALERLNESGEGEAVRTRHLRFFVSLAKEAEPQLSGAEQVKWLSRLEQEHENLRAALRWSLSGTGKIEAGAQLTCAVFQFWQVRGYWFEGRSWLMEMLKRGELEDQMRGQLLTWAAFIARRQGNYAEAVAQDEEALLILREIGDKQGTADALNNLGIAARFQGDYALAQVRYEESLAIKREIGDKRGIGSSLLNLGVVASHHGDYALAQARYEEALRISREIEDKSMISITLSNLGLVASHQGEYSQAQARYEESLRIKHEIGDKVGIAVSLEGLGLVALRQKEYALARARCEEALVINRESGNKAGIAFSLCNLGIVAVEQERYNEAEGFLEEALPIYREIGNKRGIAGCLEAFAGLAHAQGRSERAVQLFGSADALREAIGSPMPPVERAGHEHSVATLRDMFGAEYFKTAWTVGRKMTMEQAIELAMRRDH